MKSTFLLAASIVAFGLLSGPAKAQTVGTVAALQTDVIRAGVNLSVGQTINANDTVQTNATGISQFQFSDRSSAKLGPNSQVTFTNNVVNVAGRNSSIAVRMTAGIGRFVGSDATKSNPLVVETPNMALGVLGGHLDVVIANGETTAVLQSGTLVCLSGNGGDRRVVRRSGFGCVASRSGRINVQRIDQSLTMPLDTTAIPNVAPNSQLSVIQTGPAPIQQVMTQQPLACGSTFTVGNRFCGTQNGGYPFKGPTETVRAAPALNSPPAGSRPLVNPAVVPLPAETVVVTNSPPTGTFTVAHQLDSYTVDDMTFVGIITGGFGNVTMAFEDLDGDSLMIVGGPYTSLSSSATLEASGNGFIVSGNDIGEHTFNVMVTDGVNTVPLDIILTRPPA